MDKKHDLINKNLIWTISENYHVNLDLDIFDNLDFYIKMTTSYAFHFDNNQILFTYMAHLRDIDKHKTFLSLFLQALSFFSYKKLLDVRPVISEYKDNYYKVLYKKLNNRKRNDIIDEIRYTLTSRYFNEVPKTTKEIRSLCDKISEFQRLNTIDQVIECFENLLDNNFHFTDLLAQEEVKERKKFEKKKEKEKSKMSKNLLEDEYGLIGSAEFTTDLDLDGLTRDEETNISLEDLDKDNLDDRYLFAQNIFGANILNSKEKLVLENEICKGLHSNSKILITDGRFKNNLEANYRQRRLDEIKDENLDYFNFFKNKYTRDQYKIERSLKLSLIRNTENINKHSKNGIINPGNIYRAIYLNDNKVFIDEKIYPDTSLSIDILIDGSASQQDRKEKIASWVYVVANALVSIGLPTRVMSFSNIENFMGLKIYRDYKDNISKNENIFTFLGQGSNRDGLAFKLVSKLISSNNYKQKILIHFTDGKPFDVRTKSDNKKNITHVKYSDKIAEDDTAIEFRRLEQNDILPLVIFTGNEEDLYTMKKIYGNNFAYIKDLDRFSSIIVQYIKRILED